MLKSKVGNDRQKWEYNLVLIEAKATAYKVAFDSAVDNARPGTRPKYPKYSPREFIRELDGYGDEGWELIDFKLVTPDKGQTVLVYDEDGTTVWDNFYLCTFMRPKAPR